MTIYDAILGLRHWYEEYKAKKKSRGLEPWDEHRMNMLLLAIEALEGVEKQTTKYKHICTRLTYWGKYKYIFKCETCGLTKEFTDNHTAQYQYCPSCGRKIDWSKPKGNDCDFMFIDEVVAYDTQKED